MDDLKLYMMRFEPHKYIKFQHIYYAHGSCVYKVKCWPLIVNWHRWQLARKCPHALFFYSHVDGTSGFAYLQIDHVFNIVVRHTSPRVQLSP